MPAPGTYVVAVSGGVDSIALLHALQAQPGYKFVVAHYDHGIRDDSSEDRRLVQQLARQYQMPFVYEEGRLGAGTSEAEARDARYNFLRRTQAASEARALITAHHQDDVLETAIINILRGTGRKGLTALRSHHDLVRPLLDVPKRDLVAWAQSEGLVWREDSSNYNLDYLRNYVRHRILPRFDDAARTRLWELINDLRFTNDELDYLLINQLQMQSQQGRLDRQYFLQLPYSVAREVIAAWLRAHGVSGFDSQTLERLVVGAKTGGKGQRFDVRQGVSMVLEADHLALTAQER